jgi:tRNA pseudouridine13 synthase
MDFQFKQQARDFFVSEILPFELDGEGDALFVYFEKRNITTHDVIDHLRERFKISRKTLGIAGLKDKRAVAKQWISIYNSALDKLGGEAVFIDALEEIVRIIQVDRHAFPIGMSTPIQNIFHIRLRSERRLGQEEKKQALEIVEELLHTGYPNLFGEQRFGINGKNRKQ